MINNDTIYALSSANGKAAIALFRISGNNCEEILSNLTNIKKIIPNKTTLVKVYKDKKKLELADSGLITFYKSPKSYTGEDLIELSVHGGFSTIKIITNTLSKTNLCRIAEPGEFTRRAFENNKLDLTQVEAVADLINAKTEFQRKQALGQLDGFMGKKLNLWTNKIKKLLAIVETAIDFSEEEIPNNLIAKNKEQTKNIIKEIKIWINDKGYGENIRNGFNIAILGKPNVGKSSLINRLANRELAIVSEIPGTTRDIIELDYDIKGLPVIFYDTAGLRETYEKIEKIGVIKAINKTKNSSINLILITSIDEINEYNTKFDNIIFIQTKIDIYDKILKENIVHLSSKTGEGVEKLLDVIYNSLMIAKESPENIYVSRERHRNLLEKSCKCLKNSVESSEIDIIAEEIRESLKYISKITGKYDIDEILDIIFNEFCIGK